MRYFSLLILLFSSCIYSQNKITYDINGLNGFKVVEINNVSQTKIFNSTIKWINNYFDNPNDVIYSKVDNNLIIIEENEKNGICYNDRIMTCLDTNYRIVIFIKHNKYIFIPIKISYKTLKDDFIDISSKNDFYNRKGKLKNTCTDIPFRIEHRFDYLSENLKKYIEGEI